jgi:phospholipid-binding lipoprotein MlaA
MLKHFKTIALIACVASSGLALNACSSSSKSQIYAGDIEISDPMEETNRSVFAFNAAVDDTIINPIIKGYRYATPEYARDGLGNFLQNLKTPVSMGNNLLQVDLPGVGNNFVRASINTLLGLGGLVDLASIEGIEADSEDFGQTLAIWGAGHGPYMVAPLFGGASVRDHTGFLVDSVADPLNLYLGNIDEMHLAYQRSGLSYLDLRDNLYDVLAELEKSSIDYYATVRSAYYQNREAAVEDQKTSEAKDYDLPDFDEF